MHAQRVPTEVAGAAAEVTAHGMDLLEGLLRVDYRETLAAVEGRADLICMSPPYEDARSYGADVSWKFQDYQALGDAVKAALRPDGGQCLMVLGGSVRDFRGDGYTERSDMPWRVMLDWKDRLGLVSPDYLAFGRDGQPGLFPNGFKTGWEPLLWFSNPGDNTLNQLAIGTPTLPNSLIRRKGQSGRRAGKDSTDIGGKWRTKPDKARPSTLWQYGQVGNSGTIAGGPTSGEDHPARFPYRLARDIVKCFSSTGDLVVDPFLGSGTTMIAALDHGRRFFGGDLLARERDGKAWIDIAREIAEGRYAQMTIAEMMDEKKKAEQVNLFSDNP